MSVQSHHSDPRILSRRTLKRDHGRLAELLRPGMLVLDVGCGTGAITTGIAQAVQPGGYVVGIDRDEALLAAAREEHQHLPNLSFEAGDALDLDFEKRFDLTTSARTLQWISRPELAVAAMFKATKPNGHIVVLDYNHALNSWEPDPPAEFRRFYDAFLEWRAANNWDNRMGDQLEQLFRSAGLVDVQTHNSDDTVISGAPDFPAAAAVWLHSIQTIGLTIAEAGFIDSADLSRAEDAYRKWMNGDSRTQTLSMRTVEGRVP